MSNGPRKRAFNEGKRHFKPSKKQKVDSSASSSSWPDGSNEQVLVKDVNALLAKLRLQSSADQTPASEHAATLPELFTEVELDIHELSSIGDGLAVLPGSSQVVVVPFVTPGDSVKAKLIRHDPHNPFTVADLVSVVKPSPLRDDSRIKCRYFAKCGGCQFQMMDGKDQLAHKSTIISKAYENFSGLPAALVPAVKEVYASPRSYGYRTKLTPHFDGPAHGRRDRRHGQKVTWTEVPAIGFMLRGTRKTIDIEDCPIGTEAVLRGMKQERERVSKHIDEYQRGATLLLREHTVALEETSDPQDDTASKLLDTAPAPESSTTSDAIVETVGANRYVKTCITDQRAISTEYIGTTRFDNPAGAFFQNNNSILPLFISTIASHIFGPPSSSAANPHSITHLVDAYSGSGLFTISLSHLFEHSIGIDISAQSITWASRNAALNRIPESKARFIAGDAADIFAHVRAFPADRTAVVLDPSRKGCDMPFLTQLLDFAPRRVVYVSCNVHTQARDVGVLCGDERGKYEVEALMGFDFFPQTAHVEGLAILRRKDGHDGPESGAEPVPAEGS